MTTATRRVKARRARGDSGLTLMELVVAMMIIGVVLVGLVLVQTSALLTTAQTKQRTQATAVANETMEELRALPWLVLAKGLNSSFATAAGGDGNISAGRFRPPANTAIDEALVTDSSQATDKLPLSGPGGTNKTVSSDPAIPGIRFTTRVYVTRASATANELTLSVVTTWVQNGTGKARTVIVRSQAYAPDGGCGDRANQPFLGSCQALLAAQGGAAGPLISIDPAPTDPAVPLPAGTPLLPGLGYGHAVVSSFGAGAATSSQQSTRLESDGTAGGVTLTPVNPDDAEVDTASEGVANQASNDVGAQGAAPPNPAAVVGVLSGTSRTLASGSSTLTLSPGTGATGTAKTSLTTSCQTGVPAGQGCASGASSGGSGSSAILTVGAQPFTLVELSASTTSSFGARFTTAPGAAAVACTALSGPGCASGGAARTLSGTSRFAAGPWSGGAAPDGLVTLAGYTDSVLAERGESQKTATPAKTRSGTLRYWTGAGYANIALSSAAAGPFTTSPVTWTSGTQTVTAVATVTVTAAASLAQQPDPTACRSGACVISADTGTVTVSVSYTVNDGVASYALSVGTGYGSSQASASFKAAPLA